MKPKKQWRGSGQKQWKKKPPPPRASKHNHVGHMIYTPEGAACRECGQVWDFTERGWIPCRRG